MRREVAWQCRQGADGCLRSGISQHEVGGNRSESKGSGINRRCRPVEGLRHEAGNSLDLCDLWRGYFGIGMETGHEVIESKEREAHRVT